MHILRRAQFGNPILRTSAQHLTRQAIIETSTQVLLKNMRYTLEKKSYGVGLAAPQIQQSLAIAIVGIKPTPTRPNLPAVNLTLINPKITGRYGKPSGQWEGCISGPDLYGKALRYPKIRLHWLDEKAHPHEKYFEDLLAQVIQHEVDHLNGILFVDRVKDSKTYMTFSEYKKLRKQEKKQQNKK